MALRSTSTHESQVLESNPSYYRYHALGVVKLGSPVKSNLAFVVHKSESDAEGLIPLTIIFIVLVCRFRQCLIAIVVAVAVTDDAVVGCI